MSISHLSCPQALGEIPHDSQPEENKLAYQPVPLQDGDAENHPPPPQAGGLDGFHRSQGRLSSRSDRSRVKRSARLRRSRKSVSLQSATVRLKARTTPIHKTSRVRGGLPQAAWPSGVLLPRRLAPSGKISGITVSPASFLAADGSRPGFHNQLGKIGAHTNTATDFPRSCHRYTQSAGAAEPRQNHYDCGRRPTPTPPPAGPSQGMASISGVLGEPGRCAPGLPAAHATPAVASTQTLPPRQGLSHAASASAPGHPLAFSAMVSAGISELGQPPEGAPAHSHSDHRCLPAGMGWPLPGQCGFWGLAPYGPTPTHQCTGVSSCTPLTPLFPASCAPPICAYTHRQYHGGSIYQQARGHPLHKAEYLNGTAVDMVQARGDHTLGVLHSRPRESDSGFSVSPFPRSPSFREYCGRGRRIRHGCY